MAALTQRRLMELFSYNSETGIFTRRTSVRGYPAGGTVGSHTSGYVAFSIDGKSYKAHRLAWLYVHGILPMDQIDHIDGQPDHNWISNLRCADRTQNKANSRRYTNNSSGFKGVRYHRPSTAWQARISCRGKRYSLGYYKTPALAHFAYVTAARQLFGEFARAA